MRNALNRACALRTKCRTAVAVAGLHTTILYSFQRMFEILVRFDVDMSYG